MLLQLALDTPEALRVLTGVADLVDLVEVGTPVLKLMGVDAITQVRHIAPGLPVLVDTKTVDAGRAEAEAAFGAGARLVTTLSCASEETHRAVREVADERGGLVMIDTITDRRLPDSVRELADYVVVHRPSDRTHDDAGVDAWLDDVAVLQAAGHRVAVAGGITDSTLDRVVATRPSIIVIGRAIVASRDPRAVTEAICRRMPERGHGWPSVAR